MATDARHREDRRRIAALACLRRQSSVICCSADDEPPRTRVGDSQSAQREQRNRRHGLKLALGGVGRKRPDQALEQGPDRRRGGKARALSEYFPLPYALPI